MTDESFFKDFLVYEYPSPSTNEGLGLPLKLEQLTIFIKLLEKLLNEITLLILLELCSRRDKCLALQWMEEAELRKVLSLELGLRRHLFHSFTERVLAFSDMGFDRSNNHRNSWSANEKKNSRNCVLRKRECRPTRAVSRATKN
jgi:hypothetical protein